MDKQEQYDINAAAKELGFSVVYIRTLIRRGVIKTTRVPLAEGSMVTKHVISKEQMDKFLNDVPHKSRRYDSRNKFILYARPEEYVLVYQALVNADLKEVADLIVPANRVMFWEGGANAADSED